MADNDKVIDVLEKLIETCKDGQNGFRDAAEHAKDSSIKKLFSELSLERAQFAGELQRLSLAFPSDMLLRSDFLHAVSPDVEHWHLNLIARLSHQ